MSDHLDGDNNGERKKNGQFANGHSGGPGRPKKKREIRYSEIMQNVCTFKEWRAICQKAVADAKRGDATARKWLSDNLIGVPKQRMELSTPEEGMTITHVNNWRDSTLPTPGTTTSNK